jgi:hypothetical protein
MKKITLLSALCFSLLSLFAQNDSTKVVKADTTIIKKLRIIIQRLDSSESNKKHKFNFSLLRNRKKGNLETNWVILDLGVNNFTDNTNYAAVVPNSYLSSGINASSFKLNSGKSLNFNFWVVNQKYNLYKHYLNLKYGIGLEYFNYRYKSNVSYTDNPTTNIFMSSTSFTKNKLGLKYITVPLLLQLNTTPNKNGLRLAAGVSAGYLLNSNNKQVSNALGKRKNNGDFDLNKFKTSLIGEIGISRITLYGSLAMQNIHKNYLEQKPYSIGIRFSKW